MFFFDIVEEKSCTCNTTGRNFNTCKGPLSTLYFLCFRGWLLLRSVLYPVVRQISRNHSVLVSQYTHNNRFGCRFLYYPILLQVSLLLQLTKVRLQCQRAPPTWWYMFTRAHRVGTHVNNNGIYPVVRGKEG